MDLMLSSLKLLRRVSLWRSVGSKMIQVQDLSGTGTKDNICNVRRASIVHTVDH